MTFASVGEALIGGATSAALGFGLSKLMPKPKMPALPAAAASNAPINITLPASPAPETIEPVPPPAPAIDPSTSAALQRSRLKKSNAGATGNSDIVLTTPAKRERETFGTVQRKTLLGG